MTRRIAVACTLILVLLALVACGSTLAGTSWQGVIGLTQVTVKFDSGNQYTSDQLSSGTYSADGDQVTLTPSNHGSTRIFTLDGSLMQGTVDGFPVTLTKQ